MSAYAALGTGIASLISSLFARSAAKKATEAGLDATNYAAELQNNAAQQALKLQAAQFAQQQQNIQPWVSAGTGGINKLADLLGVRGSRPIYGPSAPGGTGTGGAAGAPGAATGAGSGDPSKLTGGYGGGLLGAAASTALGGFPGFLGWQLAQALGSHAPDTIPEGIDPNSALGKFYTLWINGERAKKGLAPLATDPATTPAGGDAPTDGIDDAEIAALFDAFSNAPAGQEITGYEEIPPSDQFGDLLKPFQFDPNGLTADPGYQFRLKEGMKALQHSAAAKGGALGGNSLMALNDYAQGSASDEFDKMYGRQFNEFQTNQGNLFNRLASLSGVGQQAITTLGAQGANAAGNAGNVLTQNAGNQADLATQAGAIRASGYGAGSNILNGGIQTGLQGIMSLFAR